jgi:hypothetical protein
MRALLIAMLVTGCAAQVEPTRQAQQEGGPCVKAQDYDLSCLPTPVATWCVDPGFGWDYVATCATLDPSYHECLAKDGTWWLIYPSGEKVHRGLSLADDPGGTSTLCYLRVAK